MPYSYSGARAAASLPAGEARRAGDRRLEDGGAGLGLQRQSLVERQPEALDRGAAVGEHRLLWEGGEALGDLQRALEVAAVLDHLGDDAPVERLGGVDDAAAEDQVEAAAKPDDARQPLGPAVDERDAPAPFGESELRALGGDPQVAPQRQLEAAGQAPARDGGDRRLRGGAAGEAERARLAHQARAERVDRLEVGAGTERHTTRAGDDQHACAVVGLELLERVLQRVGRRPVDGVAPLLAIDGEDSGGADALEYYQPPCHWRLAARAFVAFFRASLRLSRCRWSIESRKMVSGKKTIRMKPALVTTLSLVSPYQPWP